MFLQTVLNCWIYQLLYETSFQIINIYSITGQNQASVLLAIQDIVWHRCGFWTILIICSSTYNQGPSPCARAIALTRLTLHSSQLIPTQN
jgi:hypothetical protein